MDTNGDALAGGGWEHLAPGVARRRLPFLDVTIGAVVGAGRLLVVDSGSTLRDGAAIDRGLRDLTGRAVTDVALTHGHFDHVLGTAALAPGERLRTHAHAGLAGALAGGRDALRADAVVYGVDPADAAEAVAALVLPGEPVDARRELDLGGRAVHLVAAGPGHTAYDLAVVVPGTPTVVFCGDLVEESGAPQAGPDAVPAAWPAALDRLLALGGEGAVYVPGHGAVVGAAFVREQRDALAARAAAGPGSG